MKTERKKGTPNDHSAFSIAKSAGGRSQDLVECGSPIPFLCAHHLASEPVQRDGGTG